MTNFDEHAAHWDDDPEKQKRAQTVADAMRRGIPLTPDMHALEFGCGTGLLSFALQKEFASITLADTSAGMLEVLSKKIEAARAQNMFAVMIDPSFSALAGKQFDIVYTLMALHHVQDVGAILKRFHKILKPGGWLAIVDLDLEDGSFHGAEETGVHHGFDRGKLQSDVQQAGFAQVAFSTTFTMHKHQKEFRTFLMTAQREV